MSRASQRLWAAAILGGVLAMIVLVVVVIQFGRKDPSPPSLQDNPELAITGRIAYVNQDNCIVIAEASGASREEVYCQPQLEALTWVDADTLAFISFTPVERPAWVLLDLATRTTTRLGGVVNYGHLSAETSVNGEFASINEGEVLVAKDGQVRTIAEFDIPEYHWPQFLTWSPDGEWILLAYYGPRSEYGQGELWIIRRDGSVRGTIATDYRGYSNLSASWYIEGRGYLPAHPDLPTP
ncbi:MAG: hypothetical protein IT303_03855 [Dehalococcoidia bacterium]|nr:hypothetical protein [Dehalococcoidia bacterium]